MRNLKTINDEIDSIQKAIQTANDELKGIKKTKPEIGAGIRAIFWMAISIFFLCLRIFPTNGNAVFFWISLLFCLLLFIASVKFCRRPLNLGCSIFFLVVFSAAFILNVRYILITKSFAGTIDVESYASYLFHADLFNAESAENLMIPNFNSIFGKSTSVNVLLLISSVYFIIPNTILFIGAAVKTIRNSFKTNKIHSQKNETQQKIDEHNRQLEILNAELAETTAEYDKLFETASAQNDVDAIKELAALNYDKATEWMKNYDKKQRKAKLEKEKKQRKAKLEEEKNQAYADYLIACAGKDYTTIKKIADKYYIPEACLDTADHLLSQDFELMTKGEKISTCEKALGYLKKTPANDPNTMYLRAVAECFSASYDGDEWKVVLANLRKAKESEELRPEYRDCIDNFIKTVIDCIERCDEYDKEQADRASKNKLARQDKDNYHWECKYKAGGYCNYLHMPCQHPANVRDCDFDLGNPNRLTATYIGPEY